MVRASHVHPYNGQTLGSTGKLWQILVHLHYGISFRIHKSLIFRVTSLIIRTYKYSACEKRPSYTSFLFYSEIPSVSAFHCYYLHHMRYAKECTWYSSIVPPSHKMWWIHSKRYIRQFHECDGHPLMASWKNCHSDMPLKEIEEFTLTRACCCSSAQDKQCTLLFDKAKRKKGGLLICN